MGQVNTIRSIGLTITIRPVPPSHRGPLPAPAPLAPRSRAPARAHVGRRPFKIQPRPELHEQVVGWAPLKNHMKNSRPLPVWVKVAEPSAIVPVSARDTAIPRSDLLGMNSEFCNGILRAACGAAGGGGGGGPNARQVPRVTEPRRSYALSSERAHKGCEAVTCRAADQNWSIF